MIQIDELIRTSRRTIALIVKPDGKVVVRAPKRATRAEIFAFVNEKTDWIRAKQAEAKTWQAERAVPQFISGEAFLYLGERYPLDIVARPGRTLALVDGHFILSAQAQPHALDLFTAWYKLQAGKILNQRINLYAEQNHLKYNKVRISSARTRWGSCSSKGTLSFSWRLVMAPLEVIDYVVVHELTHTIQPNHSAKFWQQVAAVLPEYTRRRQWLKQNGLKLTLE